MSSSKASAEDQMGSGESDDEFYKVNMDNLNKLSGTENCPSGKNYNNERTKVKYDYKFDSSSDDESDDASSKKNPKSQTKPPDANGSNEKKEESKELAVNTGKVAEKPIEEIKSQKNGSDKVKNDVAVTAGTSTKIVPSATVCVPSPVVVVPPPIIVPQTHSVMAMGPTGMIVQPTIALANQNVMIPSPNILNLPGNVLRAPNPVSGLMAAPGGAVMSMGNPNMISPIQSQGNVLGMTNDLLQLQGNILGLAAPGNMMQMPGLCVPGNMIPVQGALQSNIMRIPGAGAALANQAIMNNQGSIIGGASSMMTSPRGVMINPGNVLPIANVMGSQGSPMRNAENLMLNMNNLGTRMNYPGNLLSAQVMNNVANTVTISKDIGKPNSQVKSSDKERLTSSNPSSKTKIARKKRTNNKNWEENDDADEYQDEVEEEEEDGDEDEDEEADKTNIVKETTNTFKNDGSFMEMFKKMSEANSKGLANKDESSSAETNESETASVKKPPVLLSGIVGKRRGGRVLKTGLVKKAKKDNETEEEKGPRDAWAMYMAEVKKYREASCEEEGKTRPLLKMTQEKEFQLSTAPFDPRFPNTNQTRYCFQSYVDFFRCQKKRGEDYEPCMYFKKVYKAMCPNSWIESWDSQREAGTFPAKI